MRRREFITLLGGAAAAWPLAARAQQSVATPRIGVLTTLADKDSEGQLRVAVFRQELQKLGWIEGRNIRFEYRWAAGDAQRLRAYAEELVGMAPAVILAANNTSLRALARGHSHCADCVCAGRRSSRQRARGEPRASGRQHHRVRSLRARDCREMARAAQGDRTEHCSGCRHLRPNGLQFETHARNRGSDRIVRRAAILVYYPKRLRHRARHRRILRFSHTAD